MGLLAVTAKIEKKKWDGTIREGNWIYFEVTQPTTFKIKIKKGSKPDPIMLINGDKERVKVHRNKHIEEEKREF
jgi:hypothetical protein